MRVNTINWDKLSTILGEEIKNFAALKEYLDGELYHPLNEPMTPAWLVKPTTLPTYAAPTLVPVPESAYGLFNNIILAAVDLRAALLTTLPRSVQQSLCLAVIAPREELFPLCRTSLDLLDTVLAEVATDKYDQTARLYNCWEEFVAALKANLSQSYPQPASGTYAFLTLRLLFVVETYLYWFGKLTTMVSRQTMVLADV